MLLLMLLLMLLIRAESALRPIPEWSSFVIWMRDVMHQYHGEDYEYEEGERKSEYHAILYTDQPRLRMIGVTTTSIRRPEMKMPHGERRQGLHSRGRVLAGSFGARRKVNILA